jgi:hypothetical protein
MTLFTNVFALLYDLLFLLLILSLFAYLVVKVIYFKHCPGFPYPWCPLSENKKRGLPLGKPLFYSPVQDQEEELSGCEIRWGI